jgi:16S rRNA processing protein RimM
VDRAALPAPEETEAYYHADLIGLAAEDPQGQPLGRIAAVENYGAGDYLEIEPPQGETLLIPFTKAAVPLIDIEAGRVVVALPEEIEAR